jgi:sugar phosphate isomerase/epimerase
MRTSSTRRKFIGEAIAAATMSPLAKALAAFAPIPRVGGSLLTATLNAYSFNELLNENLKDASKGIDLFGVCDFCAKQEIEACDLTGYYFPGYPKPPADDYIARIKRHTHDLGITISGTGVSNDFVTADKAARAAGVQHVKEWIEVASKLGAPVLRLFADPRPPFKNWQEACGNVSHETVEAWMADHLRDCAEHAQKWGIIIGVQNHGDFIASAEQHLRLLKRVDHEWCMALVDTGKYMTDDPYADFAMMVPYSVNWQIKETTRSRTDSPRTDLKRLVKIIHDGGYRGFLPIETLTMKRKDYDPFAEVTKLLTELRQAIASVATA